MKSVKGKILLWMLILVIGSVTLIGVLGYLESSSTVLKLNEDRNYQIAQGYALAMGEMLSSSIKELKIFSERKAVQDMDWDKFKDNLREMIKLSDGEFVTGIMADSQGNTNYITLDKEGTASTADREYFKKIMQGSQYAISNVLVSKSTGKKTFVIAIPIKDQNGNAKGMLGCTVNMDKIRQVVLSIKIGSKGHGYIVQNDGLFIVHPEEDIEDQFNLLNATDKDLKSMGNDIINGKNGYKIAISPDDHVKALFTYVKIPYSPGWFFGTAMPLSQIQSYSQAIMYYTLIVGIIVILIAIFIAWYVGNSIGKPIKAISNTIAEFGKGDLTVKVEDNDSKDEVGVMSRSLKGALKNLQQSMLLVIDGVRQLNEISSQLKDKANATMDINVKVYDSMDQITNDAQNTSAAIEEVNASTEEVASSAQNVANIAQDLTEKTFESVETSKNSITLVKSILDNITNTSDLANHTKDVVLQLTDNTKNIGEIVNAITSISEQTALLALNAAIEAARAGEAGKGFAVIADEIRGLADESKKSTEKIADILNNIKSLTEQTEQSTLDTIESIVKISDAAKSTSKNLDEVLEQFEQISSMVENLASTAEEQSAASEEIASATTNAAQTIDDIARALEGLFEDVKKQKQDLEQVDQLSKDLADAASNLDKASKGFKVE